MYGVSLIFVLAVVGGLIAYAGDRIGMKIGRKKLTFMGLRPKYTSILITILTGILISAASITILSIVSADVRTALFNMHEIQETLATTQYDLQELKGTLSEQQALLADAVMRRDQAERDKVAIEAAHDRAEEELRQVEEQLEQATSDLEEAQDQLNFQTARVQSLVEAGQQLDEQNAELRNSIASLQETEEQLRAQLVALIDEYNGLQNRYDTLSRGNLSYRADEIVYADVMAGGRAWNAVQEDLVRFLARADEEAGLRGAQIAGGAGALREEDFADAVTILSQSGGDWVVRARALGNTVVGEELRVWIELIPGEKVFDEGEEIARTVIDGQQVESVEDELFGLLGRVNDLAIEVGMVTDSDGTVGEIQDGQQFLDTVAAVRRSAGPVVVIARAVDDVWTTEGPLRIQLEVQPAE